MDIVSSSVYVGPNVYSRQPLIRLAVDLRRRADTAVSHYADELIEPLLTWLPGLATARTELGTPLIERMRNDPTMRLGEVLVLQGTPLMGAILALGNLAPWHGWTMCWAR